MLVDPSNSAAGSAVTGAIQQASQATGTSFNYLLATAQVESGLNPQAGAPTSSARGLFQFIDTTWLAAMKQYGPALGYGSYADAITTDGTGGYFVRDPTMRSEILKLRSDPTANAVMAGAFTKANAAALSERLGRSPSEGQPLDLLRPKRRRPQPCPGPQRADRPLRRGARQPGPADLRHTGGDCANRQRVNERDKFRRGGVGPGHRRHRQRLRGRHSDAQGGQQAASVPRLVC
jgi:Transglycosylase SLT domain